jgi:hypothetical protein
MANEIYNDFCRNPWKTEKDVPAGYVGYCGPETTPEPTTEDKEDEA